MTMISRLRIAFGALAYSESGRNGAGPGSRLSSPAATAGPSGLSTARRARNRSRADPGRTVRAKRGGHA